MSNILFGKSEADKKAHLMQQCRDVHASIMNLGPTQQQILFMIQLLACELEKHEQMVAVASTVRKFMNEENVLLSPIEEI